MRTSRTTHVGENGVGSHNDFVDELEAVGEFFLDAEFSLGCA